MREIKIDILIEKLEELKVRGKTKINVKGEWKDDDGKIHSLETILKEYGEDYYF